MPTTIPEEQRHTVQVKLRLAPSVAGELRALATKHEATVGDVVALALASLPRRGIGDALRAARDEREEAALEMRRKRKPANRP